MSNSPIKVRCTRASLPQRIGEVYEQHPQYTNEFYHSDGGFVRLVLRDGQWVSKNEARRFELVEQSPVGAVNGGSADAQAYKADDGKPNWFLLMSAQGCAKALAGVVRVLSFAVRSKDKGGKGYVEHSWRQVPNAEERYQAALYRHLNKIELGETLDDESGESHWYHVATNALFLAELHNAEEKQ